MPDRKKANRDVFLNCPFDPSYLDIFRAIVFSVRACGFRPRCAKDVQDSASIRIDTITDLIENCDWGIHDLSAVELDASAGVPRFNMPLELGMAIGARRFGGARQRIKRLLILERDAHRYDASISDISGQDIAVHRGDPARAIVGVRNWLSDNLEADEASLPGGRALAEDYRIVRGEIDRLIEDGRLDPWAQMTHRDFVGCLEAALPLIAEQQPE